MEFENYKVGLKLKDGTRSSGIISKVTPKEIILSEVVVMAEPMQKHQMLKIGSNQIADLKILEAPRNDGDERKTDLIFEDEAVVYAKARGKTEESSWKKENEKSREIRGHNGFFSVGSHRFLDNKSNKVVPSVSPVQLLELERSLSELFGVSPALMAECAGTNLSQYIFESILNFGNGKSRTNGHVVLLIGNQRCGARAFATGRHLVNHGIKVAAFVSKHQDSDKELVTQMTLFRNAGGTLVISNFDDFLFFLQPTSPPCLIIDALQGYDDYIDDFFYSKKDRDLLFRLIAWISSTPICDRVMLLDIPLGIDPGSGILSNSCSKNFSKWCVSMAFPISGILHAYKNFALEKGSVTHIVIDVGIPNLLCKSIERLNKFENFWHSSASTKILSINNAV